MKTPADAALPSAAPTCTCSYRDILGHPDRRSPVHQATCPMFGPSTDDAAIRQGALPSAAPLDLDALERLARDAQKPVAAWRQPDDDDDGVQWDRWRSAQGEFGATVHSPEFILALVAAARRGVADTEALRARLAEAERENVELREMT